MKISKSFIKAVGKLAVDFVLEPMCEDGLEYLLGLDSRKSADLCSNSLKLGIIVLDLLPNEIEIMGEGVNYA
ncbi:MAG: hypothetical protein RLN62_07095 [Rickettsiales bacterium]